MFMIFFQLFKYKCKPCEVKYMEKIIAWFLLLSTVFYENDYLGQ